MRDRLGSNIHREEEVQGIRTERLLVVPCSARVARTAVRGGARKVSRLLGIRVDPSWPPPDLREVLPGHADALDFDPSLARWGIWLVLDAAGKNLVGDAGFKGPPGPEGEVELGYGIVEPYRRRGYATEVVRALSEWAFEQKGVERILARCLSENVASQGVLRNAGFQLFGIDDDVQEWELL